MIPIIPILAWTGGIAAGAKVAGGVVRGVGELVRGRPVTALVEVSRGIVSPVCLVCEQLKELGGDIRTAVLGRSRTATTPHANAPASAPRPRRKRRHQVQANGPAPASKNGQVAVATSA